MLRDSNGMVRGFVPESLKSDGCYEAVGPSDGIPRSRAFVRCMRPHATQQPGRGERVIVRGIVRERAAHGNTGLSGRLSRVRLGVVSLDVTLSHGYHVVMKLTSFILRDIDTKLWKGVKARAEKDGHSLRWVLLALLRTYVEGGTAGAVGQRQDEPHLTTREIPS